MFRNPLTDGILILVVLLLFFGPKRLPELGKGIGEGIRGFKEGIGGGHRNADEEKPALTAAEHAPSTESRETADTPAERSA
jgi:sec-independent protein translocase protein TatA